MKAALFFAVVALPLVGRPAHGSEPGSYFYDIAGEAEVSDAELPVFEFELQYRPRAEKTVNGDIRFSEALGESMISHRARFGANVWYRNLRAHMSVQNIREFGDEQTDPPIELFEAFIEAHGHDWGLRLGPQMITFSTGRVLTAPIWSQRSRTLDAARLVYDRGDLMADVIAGRRDDGLARDIFAADLRLRFGPLSLGIPTLVETNNFLSDSDRKGITGDFSRFTSGLTAGWKGRLHASTELLAQFGDYEGDGTILGAGTESGDIAAYMIHGDVGYRFDEILHPNLWVDYLSGDDSHDDDDYHTFDTVLGYRRRFYGRADRFIRIPRDSGNGGLLDLAVKNQSKVGPGSLYFEYHYFVLPEENIDGDEGSVGTEVDLRYRVPLWDKLGLTVASIWFVPLGDYRDEVQNGQLVTTDEVFVYHHITLDLQLP